MISKLLFASVAALTIFSALLVLVRSASGQEEEPLSVQTLFKSGKACRVEKIVNPIDFEIGKDGEKYFVVEAIVYACDVGRDATFDFTASDQIKRSTTVAKEVKSGFLIPLFFRVTEENFRWNFTPARKDVVRGSVANPSLLTAGSDINPRTSYTTASVTPTANSIVFVHMSGQDAGTELFTAPSEAWGDTGGGSWTVVLEPAASNGMRTAIWRRQIGTGPSAGTLTINRPSTNLANCSWVIWETTGHDTTTPISEITSGFHASNLTVNSGSLAAVAAGNLVILHGGFREADIFDPDDPDFTLVGEAFPAETNGGVTGVWYDANDDEVQGDIVVNVNEAGWAIILEIAAAGGAAAAQVIMID